VKWKILISFQRMRSYFVYVQSPGSGGRSFRVHVMELRSGHRPRPYAHVWTTLTDPGIDNPSSNIILHFTASNSLNECVDCAITN
jgi:hypothetical protein